MSERRIFDPERLLRSLANYEVRFVLVGATAARLYGFPRMTADIDIVPAAVPDNLERLASALKELDARVYTESVPAGLPADLSAAMLGRVELWNLVTLGGRLDVIFTPAGTGGYEDLAANAEWFEAFGVSFRVARLEDILRSKVAADRPQDRNDVVLIRELLERKRSRGD